MKIFSILLIIVSSFILNIWLYYTSESYRNFLKELKQEPVISKVDDNYDISEKQLKNIEKDSLENELNKKVLDNKKNTSNKKDNLSFVEIKTDKKEISDDLLSSYFKELLNKFSEFNLYRIDTDDSLMDVTSEYPDWYFKYYSKDLSLYLFPTKKYEEVKDIFEVESSDDFFTINEVNNFWDKSFYINLQKRFDDWFVRFIFEKNWSVIWVKVNKKLYKKIKNIIK